VLRDGITDWVNSIFLSTRFRAWRVGGYNEFLYTFFKCLTPERINYADGWFSEQHDDTADIVLDGWQVQKRQDTRLAELARRGQPGVALRGAVPVAPWPNHAPDSAGVAWRSGRPVPS